MTIKTYRGHSIAEALARVKKELGPHAVILNTRTVKSGGLLGIGARTLHEITASDELPRNPRARTRERPTLQLAPERPTAPQIIPAPAPAPPPVPVLIPEPAVREVARLAISGPARSSIEEELTAIKRMVGQVLRASSSSGPSMPEPLFECYRSLIESEVASEIASEIAEAVRSELTLENLRDAATVRREVGRRLSAYIPVCGEASRPARGPDGRPLTAAFIGPTGVGKTTTLAKLAATYKLRHGKRVGLITCDTYRIAAVDQLRTYASIINLPMRIAMTPTEMRSAVASLSDSDVILIDTAGRPPRDTGRLDELRALLAAASPHRTHLVLSSVSEQRVMLEAAERFSSVGYDRVILTKLDEAVNFGVLVNVARRLNTRLSFLTDGQDVPDHLEPASAERIARLVMGAEGVRP